MPCGLSTHSGVAMMGYPTGVVGGKDGLPNRCEAHTSYRIRPWQQKPFLETVYCVMTELDGCTGL